MRRWAGDGGVCRRRRPVHGRLGSRDDAVCRTCEERAGREDDGRHDAGQGLGRARCTARALRALALASVAYAAPTGIDSAEPSGSAIASNDGYSGSIPDFSCPAAPSGSGGPSRSASGYSPSQTIEPYSSASSDLAGSASSGPSHAASLSVPHVSASSGPFSSASNAPSTSSAPSFPTHSGSSGPFASASGCHDGPASSGFGAPAEAASSKPFDHTASGIATSAVDPSTATASSGPFSSSREHSSRLHSASAV